MKDVFLQCSLSPDYLYCHLNTNINACCGFPFVHIYNMLFSSLFCKLCYQRYSLFFFFFNLWWNSSPSDIYWPKNKKKKPSTKTEKHSRNNSQVSLSLSPFIMTSLGRHETRGSKSECSRLNTSSFKRPRHCICNCQSKAPNDYHNTKKVGKFWPNKHNAI